LYKVILRIFVFNFNFNHLCQTYAT